VPEFVIQFKRISITRIDNFSDDLYELIQKPTKNEDPITVCIYRCRQFIRESWKGRKSVLDSTDRPRQQDSVQFSPKLCRFVN